MIIRILIYLGVGAVLFVICVRYLEKTSVFFPEKKISATPRDIGLAYEDVFFYTKDNVRLNAWMVKRPNATATILFFHGNAGNNSDRLDTIQFYYDIGVNVFIIDYRGYGKSAGVPSEQGMYIDAVGAYDYLASRKDIDPSKIIAYGASLGGVAAIDLATKRKAAALITDSTFSSAADMAHQMYPVIPSFLLNLKMNNLIKVKTLTVPKLFIHSQNDETVPYALGQKLFAAAAEPKVFITVSTLHNETRQAEDSKRVREGVRTFLKQYDLL